MINEKSYWILRRERLTAAGICIDCAKKRKKPTARRCIDCSNKLSAYHQTLPKKSTKPRKTEYETAGKGGMSFEAIAYELGVSRQRVVQIYTRAIIKLQRECRRMNLEVSDVTKLGFSMLATAEKWA